MIFVSQITAKGATPFGLKSNYTPSWQRVLFSSSDVECACEEILNRIMGESDESEAVYEAAFNNFEAGEARYVVWREVHYARGVTGAQVDGAVDHKFSGGHEQTTRLQDLQSVRGVHCSIGPARAR